MTLSSKFLPVFINNALEDARELLPRLLTGSAGWRQALAFCQHLRLAGVGGLFLTGTSEPLHLRLHQSGRAFASFLSRTPVDSQLTSQCLPFFDAVAAGDLQAAQQVARHARHSWAQGEEYEEDFLFVELLMQRFFLGAPPAECEALQEHYERALQGAEDPRLGICQALLTSDSRRFTEGLALFLSERRNRYVRLATRERIAPELAATEGHFSVEGLALLRLAEQQGLETPESCLHVPSIARELPAVRFEPDSWQHLDDLE